MPDNLRHLKLKPLKKSLSIKFEQHQYDFPVGFDKQRTQQSAMQQDKQAGFVRKMSYYLPPHQ
jgi:hypothetical protein